MEDAEQGFPSDADMPCGRGHTFSMWSGDAVFKEAAGELASPEPWSSASSSEPLSKKDDDQRSSRRYDGRNHGLPQQALFVVAP